MTLTRTHASLLSDVNDNFMTQNVSNEDNDYPLLLCPTANANTNQGDKTGIFSSAIKANPSTGTITANNFQGTNVDLSSGTEINVSTGSVFTKTISANTTFIFSGVASNKAATFTLILTNGGSNIVTWPNSVKWAAGIAPTLTTSGIDILTFFTHNGGINWYGAPSIISAA